MANLSGQTRAPLKAIGSMAFRVESVSLGHPTANYLRDSGSKIARMVSVCFDKATSTLI